MYIDQPGGFYGDQAPTSYNHPMKRAKKQSSALTDALSGFSGAARKRVTDVVRDQAYDKVLPYFVRLCEEHDPPLDVDKAFRVPPGMEAYREQEKRQLKDRRDASEGVKDFRE